MTKWSKEDGGYTSHLISTITEWITAITTFLYIATYSEEFKALRVERLVVINTDNNVLPVNTNNSNNKEINNVSDVTDHI